MEDRRTVKTKKALKNAMIALIEEKEIRKITISDLTKMANVGRGTFYLHYQDIYDLLENVENDVIKDLEHLADNFYINDSSDENLLIFYEKCADYLLSNKDIVKMLLGPNGDYLFMTKYKEFFLKKY